MAAECSGGNRETSAASLPPPLPPAACDLTPGCARTGKAADSLSDTDKIVLQIQLDVKRLGQLLTEQPSVVSASLCFALSKPVFGSHRKCPQL